MHARSWWVAAALVLSTAAAADPAPKPVDIKAFRDQLIVLADADGGVYVVLPGKDSRVWNGIPKNKKLYEQVVVGRSRDGDGWDISVWAPRVPNVQPGSVQRKTDGTFWRWCGSDSQIGLSEVTGDKAKLVLDKWAFLTTAMVRKPYLLGRDDAGIYYYVDVIRDQYGGKGYRVFVGKKGAMKQRPLTDIAIDAAGDVFATKTGDLRIVHDADSGKHTMTWVKGEKRSPLVFLDTDASSALIYKDLGIYTFTGSICETR